MTVTDAYGPYGDLAFLAIRKAGECTVPGMDRLLAVMAGSDEPAWAAASREARDAGNAWGFPYRAAMLWQEAEAAACRVTREPVDPLLADAIWGTAAAGMLTGRISPATRDALHEPWLAAGLTPVLPPAAGL